MTDEIETAKGFVIVPVDELELFRGGRDRAQLRPRPPTEGKPDDWSEGLSCFNSLPNLVAGMVTTTGIADQSWQDYFLIDVTKLVTLNVYEMPGDPLTGHRFIRPAEDSDLKLWMDSARYRDQEHPGHRWTDELQKAIVPNENKGQWRKIQ